MTRKILKIVEGLLAILGVVFIAKYLYVIAYIGLGLMFGLIETDALEEPIPRYNWVGRTPPQWTPDGAQIVFEARGIYVAASDGSALRQIHGGGYRFPTLSPDGSRIMYVKRHGDGLLGSSWWEIATSTLDGRRERILTDLNGANSLDIGSPSWSPDGQRIAFVWDDTIYTMSDDGSDARPLPNLSERLRAEGWEEISHSPFTLSWSPDGQRVAFFVFRRSDESGEGSSMMYTIGIDGSGLRGFGDTSTPAWSPDGVRVALTSVSRGEEYDLAFAERLYTIGADGSEPRHIASLPRGLAWSVSVVAWSPTRSEILMGPFVASVDGTVLGGATSAGRWCHPIQRSRRAGCPNSLCSYIVVSGWLQGRDAAVQVWAISL